MSYHPLIDGPIRLLVAPEDHPKVAKGGNHAADVKTTPGQVIYAPADGKIPNVRADQLDGGHVGASFFTIDFAKAKKTDAAVRLVLAHVDTTLTGRNVVKAGEPIGKAAGEFVHVGCNLEAPLLQIVGGV